MILLSLNIISLGVEGHLQGAPNSHRPQAGALVLAANAPNTRTPPSCLGEPKHGVDAGRPWCAPHGVVTLYSAFATRILLPEHVPLSLDCAFVMRPRF